MIDMVVVMALIGVLAVIAVPSMKRISDAIALGEAQRLVRSTLQQARLKSVTSNRNIRVRFNCPVAGQMRMVELIGTPTVPAPQDIATNRCSETVYPYPGDANPLTLPNNDGPIQTIHRSVSFGATQTIEFRPTGTAWAVNADGTSTVPLAGDGVSVSVTKGSFSKAVTINALGKVQ
jgi:type II secretory pathway pseudopilin PulG